MELNTGTNELKDRERKKSRVLTALVPFYRDIQQIEDKCKIRREAIAKCKAGADGVSAARALLVEKMQLGPFEWKCYDFHRANTKTTPLDSLPEGSGPCSCKAPTS